ncbi:MAG: hypothetical protein ABJB03_09260 [Rhodoglobus sp.]
MSADREERDAELRRLLVDTANASSLAKRRPWKLVSLIAAVAIASGVTGAVSAAAIAQSSPYADEVVANLALSVARANSVAVGESHYVSSNDVANVDLGKMPSAATGLAIRTSCTEPGTINITLDGTWIGSVTCTKESPTGGGGGVNPVSGAGAHTLTFQSGGTGFEAWIVWVKEPPMPTSSPQQAAEMADGIATREEYLAAFNRFVGCMSGAGFDILGGDTDSLIIDYSITTEAVDAGVDELCYVSQFRDVDSAWQLQNENSSATADLFRRCLSSNGITPAETFEELDRQVNAAGSDVQDCIHGP